MPYITQIFALLLLFLIKIIQKKKGSKIRLLVNIDEVEKDLSYTTNKRNNNNNAVENKL